MASSFDSAGDYEVFLSFRGVDTRQGFTDILYQYLTMAEIRVFRDDDELAIGDKIDSILAGLANSKICIPIFSPKFAESKWCLREVAEMVDLKKTIVPVFYKVSPDDVKLKQGSLYWDDIRNFEEKQGRNHLEIDKWKNALKEAGSIKGRELGEKSYSKFCKGLVDEVLSKLGPRKRLEIDHFTGDANKARAMKLLDMGSSEDVVYVGIYGMGGIGKTTITKLIYNQFLSSFDYCGFVPDVREFSSGSKGIKGLAGYLYENLQPKSVTPFSQSAQIADRFKNKKVLLILDDVDSYEQIWEVAGKSSWFGLGSRIVLTTRDKKVLEDYAEESGTEIRYLEMEELDNVWALELFSRCAFGKDLPPSPYESLSKRAVAYAGGLPLAITVIAKYLRNKKEAVWEEIIKRLKTTPAKEVKDKLLISYNALDEEQKRIFLDIACLFMYYEYTESSNVFYMWEACGLCPRWSLEVLQSMSLVKLDKYNQLRMHDQLRDLGRDIVKTKSEGHLTKQSRLWEHSEIEEVLKCKKKHKDSIEAMKLEWPCDKDPIDEEFTSFDNLRYFKLKDLPLQGDFSGLLPQLKWLECSLIMKTINLVPSNLVILVLSGSDVNENWEGWSQIQELKKLKVLDLSHTRIKRTPVFSEDMALERLIVDYCRSLACIDRSIGKLHHLNYLSFNHCCYYMDDSDSLENNMYATKSLANLPESLGELHALQELHLKCTNISSLPNSIGRLEKLERLNLSGCELLVDLPESFGELYALRDLDLEKTCITWLPDSIRRLKKLESLNLMSCEYLLNLPEWLGELQALRELNLKDSEITSLPNSIGRLEKLERLTLSNCGSLLDIPESLGNLRSLVHLDIRSTPISKFPCSMGGLKKLKSLDLRWSMMTLLPESFGDLKSLVDLDISHTPITALPSTINRLSLLQTFNLDFCHHLHELPELPSSLKQLKIHSWVLKRVSDLSNLQDVTSLELIGGSSILDWNGSFPSKLQSLTIELFCISRLPDLSSCSQLRYLKLSCERFLKVLPNMSGLSKLLTLEIESCDELVEIPGIGKLRRLTSLFIKKCPALECLENLRELQELKQFSLVGCQKLMEIPGLGELQALTKVRVEDCESLEKFDNLTALKELKELTLVGCPQLAESLYYFNDDTSCSEQGDLPTEQSEAEDYPHKKRRRYQFISSDED